MCGILCLINDKLLPSTSSSPFTRASDWESRDPEYIRSLFHKELQLTQSDLNKLNNQDTLRELNAEIVRIGNDVKVDQLERINELKQQMKHIIGEESDNKLLFNNTTEQFEYLIPSIASRGPDYIKYVQMNHNCKNIQMVSSVLSLRQPFTPQPIRNDRYILQFNGELYEDQCEACNDTEYLMRLISSEGVEVALNGLNGEYAISVIDLQQNLIYFGRDSIGKRSLCFKYDHEHLELLLSSVSLPGLSECEGRTLYKLDLSTFKLDTIRFVNDITTIEPNYQKTSQAQIQAQTQPQTIEAQVKNIYQALKQACLLRQETIHPLNSDEANLAILFSGGIDCTVIGGLLIENIIESTPTTSPVNIDLLTVGFDNPRTGLVAGKTPDRELSVKSWFHLVKKYQQANISIRLIEIDIDYKLWLTHRHKVRDLIYPQQTEMDLSISMAFYFASNNLIPCRKLELVDFNVTWDQFVNDRTPFIHSEQYMSRAKVLFSGLGADELFGGYSRHRVLFSRLTPEDDPSSQYQELKKLLAYDIDVIYKRNLGRDDRVISSWGKELRYPYLDINFIRMVLQDIEPDLKIKLQWNTNKKGKLMINPIRKWILRQLAGYMGLQFVMNEEKRAIQFGSKSAKLEIGQGRSKGTDELQ